MAKPIKDFLGKDAVCPVASVSTADLAGTTKLPGDCSIPLVIKANIEGVPDDIGANYGKRLS